MRSIIILALAAASLSLGGCAQVFGSDANFQAFLKDVQTCDRHYTVAFSAGTAPLNGSAQIDCKAAVPPTTGAPPPAS